MAVFPQPAIRFTTISAAYQANPNEYVNATVASAYVVTLPPVADNPGCVVQVRKVDSASAAFTLKTADGSTIDGVAGTTGVASAATQHAGFTVANDGSNWWVIGS